MMRRCVLCLALWLAVLGLQAQEKFLIISYNVENLFDAEADSLGRDTEYTQAGARHWSYGRYQNKLQHIAQVIANIGGWQVPALVGLMEVENGRCLRDLTRYHLTNYRYGYLHREGADVRGIDCALLYDKRQFQLLDSAFIAVPLAGRPTRDIVYAKGLVGRAKADTLHVFVCHLPSQYGGAAATAHRRSAAFSVLQGQIDTILAANAGANIVVMGDMNQAPQENLRGVTNRMLDIDASVRGTHKYQGLWSFLDQFYTSGDWFEESKVGVFAPDWLLEDDPKYLDKRPLRTYQGMRYQAEGYSDHLPIYLYGYPSVEVR